MIIESLQYKKLNYFMNGFRN